MASYHCILFTFPLSLSPQRCLNLVTLKYTKKYDPLIYIIVYTPVTSRQTPSSKLSHKQGLCVDSTASHTRVWTCTHKASNLSTKFNTRGKIQPPGFDRSTFILLECLLSPDRDLLQNLAAEKTYDNLDVTLGPILQNFISAKNFLQIFILKFRKYSAHKQQWQIHLDYYGLAF
jgi:hypothetical protein